MCTNLVLHIRIIPIHLMQAFGKCIQGKLYHSQYPFFVDNKRKNSTNGPTPIFYPWSTIWDDTFNLWLRFTPIFLFAISKSPYNYPIDGTLLSDQRRAFTNGSNIFSARVVMSQNWCLLIFLYIYVVNQYTLHICMHMNKIKTNNLIMNWNSNLKYMYLVYHNCPRLHQILTPMGRIDYNFQTFLFAFKT